MIPSHDTGISEAQTAGTDRQLLDRLRKSEYTGENRCLPCTAVNVAIAAVGATAVGAVAGPLLATAGFGAALAAIWLRGYLVPGTPELTKRYLPDRVLRLFGKGRDAAPPADVDAESYLLSADVLVETPDGTDLSFAPWFASAWSDTLDEMRLDAAAPADSAAITGADEPDADAAALAALTGVPEASLSLSWGGGAAFAFADGQRIGHWESRSAFLSDVAADRALSATLDDWSTLSLAARSDVLGALRLFVERCPACDGPVALEERVVESCCSSYDVVAGRCTACDARLFEMELPSPPAVESV